MMNEENTSFPKSKIKIVLLENISNAAIEIFQRQGFQIITHKGALKDEELKEQIRDAHVLGIRSKTKLTKEILQEAKRMLCVGCFCIGTDQVDLEGAEQLGIPVFNSPFCNSRSVAELIIAEIICLSRKLGDVNSGMHQGKWNKSAVGCFEVRGKTLGIVGYGHIGTQLSVLAEGLGMKVLFYDIENIMPMGNSRPVPTLEDLLKQSDFVTLHVPQTEQTRGMITEKEINLMKKGSYLLNASRGTVVDLSALAVALKSGHLAGAAIDVYPQEPEENNFSWVHELQNCPNTILTPHIGGSTSEAQEAIGKEVADKIVKLINTGSTLTAVNFPAIELRYKGPGSHRILNTHRNLPGYLKSINTLLANHQITGQVLDTRVHVGYMIIDIDASVSQELKKSIENLDNSIKTRILY